MKTILVFFLGAAIGVIAFQYFREQRAATTAATRVEAAPSSHPAPSSASTPAATTPSMADKASAVLDQARDGAIAAKDAVAHKFEEWHLTPAEIKDDIARTGRVVRSKAQAAGVAISGSVAPARIKTVVNAKYVLDKDLSARAIDVDVDQGKVSLRGTVASPELIARAVALALDTEGVVEVTSFLTVQTP